MKVRCINAEGLTRIENGKEYTVLCNGRTTYILDDRSRILIRYRKERFEVVDATNMPSEATTPARRPDLGDYAGIAMILLWVGFIVYGLFH
jgi:hypothetical protein